MTLSCGSPLDCLRAFGRWLRERQRTLLVLVLMIAGFYALGYLTPRIAAPGTCLIYG